tara:strand:- start:111 stop:452 length:342 start_codon:yes stop_codon:yes gene_type:complete
MMSSEYNSEHKRFALMFLVHSFLYYQLGESIIEDNEYDKLSVELKEIIETDKNIPHYNIIKNALGDEASGYSIPTKAYPQEIISTALHLLYQEQYKHKVSLTDFLKSYGYHKE